MIDGLINYLLQRIWGSGQRCAGPQPDDKQLPQGQ